MGDLLSEMKEALSSSAPRTRPVRLADGSSSYLVRMLPYRRLDGVIDGLVITFFDVTLLEAAQEQRTRLAAIVASSHDAIVSRTFDGTITSWNEAATRLFGFAEQEAVGKSMFDLIIPPEGRLEVEQLDETLRRGGYVPPFESTRLSKDGSSVAVLVAISPVRDAAGGLVGSSAVYRDLTELNRVGGLRDEAHHKDRFLAALSHELRGPLASLQICMDVLQSQGPDARRGQEALAIAGRQIEHLADLVNQLLDVSRVASGRIELDRSRQNLVDVVRTSVEDQRGLLEAAGVRLDVSLPATPVWVSCDPMRIMQIVVNLIGNATKFTDSGGLVTVSLQQDDAGRLAVLTVRDDGIGIDPEVLLRLFQPFSQADSGDVRARGGLGLGLALVHALVTAHGGTVEGRSEGRGRGAEFTLRLPLVESGPAAALAAPPAPSAPEGAAGPRRRILVVEDNWDFAESLRNILELAGHEVEVAADGERALARAMSYRPEIVVCDIGLTGKMDGNAVATAIRGDASYGSPYLIALSGFGQPADKALALAAGFDRHITKAEHARMIVSAIAEVR